MTIVEFLKAIPGFDGYYASNLGNIYSEKSGEQITKKYYHAKDGYDTVGLTPTGDTKQYRYKVHRIMAQTWHPNPHNLKTVNHINFNRRDNRPDNLEWASQKDQNIHKHSSITHKTVAKRVIQATKDGKMIEEYKSIKDAAEKSGVNYSCISAACLERRRYAKGFAWFFKEDYKGQKVRKHGCCKTVSQYSLKGKFIREFDSANTAADHVGCNASTLATACRGKQKSCMGYVWKYKGKEKQVDKTIKYHKWVKLNNYPSYGISKDGKVFSFISKKILTPYTTKDSRKTVCLRNTEGKKKQMYIHRLVAMAYIPNHDKLRCVNHIDGNPSNNNVTNLEWCTHAQNSKHAYDIGLNTNKTPVLKLSPKGIILEKFAGVKDAADAIGVSRSSLSAALNEKTKTCGGYKWIYSS